MIINKKNKAWSFESVPKRKWLSLKDAYANNHTCLLHINQVVTRLMVMSQFKDENEGTLKLLLEAVHVARLPPPWIQRMKTDVCMHGDDDSGCISYSAPSFSSEAC